MSAKHLVITGMPGVGKTTVSRLLANQLGLALSDSDADLLHHHGINGHDLAAQHGVAALHRAEAAVLLDALELPPRTVIAAAGSVIEDATCRYRLTTDAELFVLVAAITGDIVAGSHRRPIDASEQRSLLERRLPLWTARARSVLRIDHRTETPDHIVARILAELASPSAHPGPDLTVPGERRQIVGSSERAGRVRRSPAAGSTAVSS